MPNKKNKNKKYNMDDEIIIGYNTTAKKDTPPKNNKKSKKNNKSTEKKNQNNNKKKKLNRAKKIFFAILKIILILTAIVGIFAFLFISPVFNITQIKVENANKISENTYVSLSEIEVGDNIFKINKSKIISRIKHEPYVDKVEIRREFPGTVYITVNERTPEYLIEKDGMYIYIDKNGYALETTSENLELPILKGIVTDLNTLTMGERLYDTDLQKFNDLIKIIDGKKNNNIEQRITSIDISNDDNYILDFEEAHKKICLGDTSNLSTKMLWIKYFMNERQDDSGTVHLESTRVYFSPN